MCELLLLAALAFWGLASFAPPLGWAAALVAPALAAVVWGALVAPKARRQLRDPQRFVLELGLFAGAAATLAFAGALAAGLILFVIFVADRAALSLSGGTNA